MGKNEIMQYVETLVERKEFPEFKAGGRCAAAQWKRSY